jgi:uncharacterized OsmC-like protein
MYGTLRGALAARQVQHDPGRFTAAVEGRIAGPNKTTIRILAIHVTYDLTLLADDRAAVERALRAHPAGCPVHESLKEAIPITWGATVRIGDETANYQSPDGRD